MSNVLKKLWALPVTLLGFVAALSSRSIRLVVDDGMVVYLARGWAQCFCNRSNTLAFTWGQVCLVSANATITGALLEHERAHMKQAFLFGALLPLAYVVGIWVAVVGGGHWHTDNFLERWARNASGF